MDKRLALVAPGRRSCHTRLAFAVHLHTGDSMALILPAHLAQVSAHGEQQQTLRGVQENPPFLALLFLAYQELVLLTRNSHWPPPFAHKSAATGVWNRALEDERLQPCSHARLLKRYHLSMGSAMTHLHSWHSYADQETEAPRQLQKLYSSFRTTQQPLQAHRSWVHTIRSVHLAKTAYV